MFCGECGHKWAPDEIASARFCAECGAPREDVPAPAVPAPPVPPPTPAPGGGGAGGHLYSSALMKPSLPVGGSSLDLPHPVALSPRSAACAQCGVPFGDSTAAFCGECGHPRPLPPPHPTPVEDDDGDLFGTGSTTSAPPAQAFSPAVAPPPAPAFSSFAAPPSVSVPFQPPHAAPLPPPSSAPPPQAPPQEASDPAPSVTMHVFPALSHLSALLSNLSTGRSDAEPDGSGAGVAVRSVARARSMDALSTRLEISAAVARNRAAPQETVDGYHVTRVHDALTVVHSARCAAEDSEEDRFYDARSLPDDGAWTHELRRHRQSGTKFTDPQFPPDARALFRDTSNKKFPHLDEFVWKWKRLSDFFNETAYVEITMLDDAKRLVCAIAMKTPAEAESILSILRQEPQHIEPAFLDIAKQAVVTGLTRKRRDHLLLCTKNMITYLSEYVQDGLQRLDLLWDKSLLEQYQPLAFAGVGDDACGYRVDASEAGMVSRVSVLVPVHFTAQGTCLFDRSREAPDHVSGVGIEPGDLKLGRLADAYLFGAMSILSTSPTALAQVFPLLDQDLVRPDRIEVNSTIPNEQQFNEEGVYAVRFWRGNRSRVVVVDDFIPCSQYGKPVFASFTGSNGKFEIWSVLIEKAYAKLHGGYESIIGGQEAYALQDLYGGVPATYKLQEVCPTEDDAWQTLSKTLAAGSLVGCVNDSVDMELPRGLQKSAAYGILKLVELDHRGELVRLVQLRNSWGVGSTQQPDKWAGSWSSSDPKWHNLSRAQKVECGFQFREDATYWMDFSAFYCFFSSIVESRNLYNFKSIPDGLGNPVAPTLSVHIITSEWNGITCGGREAMHLNPQYHLFSPASQGCALTVHLEQPSRRLRNESEYGAYIAPVVFRHGTKSQRKIDLAAGDVVATGTFISNRSCVLDTKLEHSVDPSRPFVVIPATYDGNLPGALGFSMTLFTSMPTAVVPVSDSSSLPICCVCQRALSGAFRTFTLANTEGEAAQVDRVCNDCVGSYRDRNTPVCQHCQERIEAVDGRFSGRMYTLPDGVSVHAECVDAYRIRLADKCCHCGQAIAAIPGRFDGRFFEIAGGEKCHAECMEAHQLATAKRCMHCKEPVAKIPGRFDGRFYKLATEDQLVHFECWEAYQASIAPKCVHCTQPIVVVPGRFDGRFYELTSGLGKVHFECWETYQARVMGQ